MTKLIVLCLLITFLTMVMLSSNVYSEEKNDTITFLRDEPVSIKYRLEEQPIGLVADFYNGTNTSSLEYQFDWGDGTISGWSKNNGGTHTYEIHGTFIVNVTIRDSNNFTVNKEATVTIYDDHICPAQKLSFLEYSILIGIPILVLMIIFAIILIFKIRKKS